MLDGYANSEAVDPPTLPYQGLAPFVISIAARAGWRWCRWQCCRRTRGRARASRLVAPGLMEGGLTLLCSRRLECRWPARVSLERGPHRPRIVQESCICKGSLHALVRVIHSTNATDRVELLRFIFPRLSKHYDTTSDMRSSGIDEAAGYWRIHKGFKSLAREKIKTIAC